MSRKSPHSRAVVRLAKMLIQQGRDLEENGRHLQEMCDELDFEGRARIMAGGVVQEVGECILLDARSSVMRRELATLERRIRNACKAAGAPFPGVLPR
jgi:hypothetical protein